MSRKFEFTEKFDVPPSVAHAAMTDPDLWSKRVDDSGGRADIDFKRTPDGGFTVTVVENVGAQVLPGVVRKVVRGGMKITRTDLWGPLEGDHAEGTLTGSTTGLPAKITGTLSLQPDGNGAKLIIVGESTVKIPLVGGKIEDLINKMIKDMIDQETGETLEWVAAQKS